MDPRPYFCKACAWQSLGYNLLLRRGGVGATGKVQSLRFEFEAFHANNKSYA